MYICFAGHENVAVLPLIVLSRDCDYFALTVVYMLYCNPRSKDKRSFDLRSWYLRLCDPRFWDYRLYNLGV